MPTMWARDALHVDVQRTPDGGFEIAGQDLRDDNMFGADEYEYWLTVSAGDVPKVVAALGGDTDSDDVIVLLVANGEHIVRTGERTWLRSIEVAATFESRVGD